MGRFVQGLGGLFSTDGFVPRRVCGLWPGWLVWEHVLGNALVWLAYVAMPILILRVGGGGRRDRAAFRGILRSFSLFIALCGLGHFLDMLAFFRPLYRLSGHVLVATGLVSCWTAWSLRRAWPALMAMRSPAELERVIAERTEELGRAEAARAYLATIVESSGDAIVGQGLDGVITSWNAGAERVFGFTAAEAVGRPGSMLVPPDRLGEEGAVLERLRRGEAVGHFESVRLTRDGRAIDVSLTISPIRDRSGRVVGVSRIARDVTEARRAAEALARSEERFQLLAESLPQLAWMAGPDGRITWYNRRWYDYTGTTPEQVEGWGWQSVHDPGVLPEVLGRWGRALAAAEPFEMVFPIRGADGRFRKFLTRAVPRRDPGGRATLWFGTCTDVDDQQRAEEQVRASERLYRAIGESIDYGVWVCDPEGRNTYASESFLRLVGLTQERCSRLGWAEVLHPDDAGATVEAWGRCVREEGAWDREHRVRGVDGRYHPVLARGVPVRDEGGRIVAWAGINLDIGRLRRTEQSLRQSEERQRMALSAARLAHWEWDVAADRIAYQDSLAALHGRPPGRPFSDLADYLSAVHPDDRDAVRQAASRAREPGVPFEVEYRVAWPDGSVRWLSGRAGVFPGEGGATSRMVGVALDVTDRKRAEAQIRALNEGLERRVAERAAELGRRIRLIDQAHEAILIRTEGGVISSWNRGAERIYGWAAEQAVGRVTHELLGTQFPRPLAEIEGELARLGSWDGELVHERRDGVLIVVASRWFSDREGSADGAVLEIHTDITERKASQERLRRSEAALKASQRMAGVGSWEWDPAGDLVTWSDELYRIAGRDPALPAPNYAEHAGLYTPESLARHAAAVGAALEAGTPYEIELEMIVGDGRRRILALGEAVRGPDGRVVALRGVVQDVTDRKRAEEDLRRARDQAMAATRAKSEFLANMSHEIRTPMNGVVGMTELLLDTRLDEVQRDYAETIRTSGEALLTVINDILDLSKIEAGKMALEERPFDLARLVEEVAGLLAPRARQKRLALACRVDPEVPARLVGDPARIRQVLTNLAGNAVKFTDRGEVALEARLLRTAGERAAIRVSVRDTGIGVPEADRDRIFESFTQVEAGSGRRHGGTGLGLAICRHLVRLMGGRIGLEAGPGGGSTFWFELELGRAPAPAGLAGLRVLVGDGDRAARRATAEALRSWGCRPVEAASGAELLVRLLADPGGDPFGAVVLDRDLPGRADPGFAAAIKAVPGYADVPVVLLAPGPTTADGGGGGPSAAAPARPARRSPLFDALCRAIDRPGAAWGPGTADPAEGRPLPAPLRVLVAEDNEVNRRVALGMVGRLGCLVVAVEDGRRAVEALELDLYDVVLMDIQMPEMDGHAATAAIRRREAGTGRHVPIIALTAHAMQGDRERCLAAGMDGYLAKPLRPGPLREALLGVAPRPGPPPGAAGGARGFDPETLEDACGGAPGLLREILEMVLRAVPEKLDRLRAAAEAGDGRELDREAHSLKGILLTVGAPALAGSCQALMQLGDSGRPAEWAEGTAAIRARWEGLRAELLRHRDSLPPLAEGPG